VVFTRPAAERIAKVVRTIEDGDRSSSGLRFERVASSLASPLKLATFTGNWATGQYRTVTIHGSTNTASVYNWCNSSLHADTANTTSTRYVIFGKASGTNSVVEIQLGLPTSQTCLTSIAGVDLTALPGYSAGSIQLLGHSAAATSGTACSTLTWYSITTCATT
jgi:hypothetical protein